MKGCGLGKIIKVAIGIIGLFFVLVILLGSGNSSNTSNQVQNPAQISAAASDQATSDTKTEDTPAETQEEKGKSFTNPASMGQPVTIESGGRTFEVSTVEYMRGEKVNKLSKEDLMYVEPPKGYEYLIVKTRVTYVKGEDPSEVSYTNFKGYANGLEMDIMSLAYPKDCPRFDNNKFMPGATKEGWIMYKAPIGAEPIVISYEDTYMYVGK